MIQQIIIGTRGSQLALWQTNWVKTQTEKQSECSLSRVSSAKTASADQMPCYKSDLPFIRKRGLDRSRVVTVTGGSREKPTVELWIVPSGAALSKPTPTVKPGDSKPTSPTKQAKP